MGTIATVRGIGRAAVRALLVVALAAAMTVTARPEPALAAGPAVRLTLSAPATSTAGKAFAVTVTARDAAGLVATSYRGRVRFTTTDPRPWSIPAAYTFTAADDGRHTFTGVKLYTAGSRTVAAFDTVRTTVKGRSAPIAVGPGPAVRLAVTAPATATAGVPVTVTATAQDRWSNVATGYRGTVRLTSTDERAVLPAAYAFTATDRGRHAFGDVALRSASTIRPVTVTVTDRATPTITGRSGGVVVGPGPMAWMAASMPDRVPAGEAFESFVTAYDAHGNLATGYRGSATLTSSDPLRPTLAVVRGWTAADHGTVRVDGLVFHSAGDHTLTVRTATTTDVQPRTIRVEPRHAAYGWGFGEHGQLGEGIPRSGPAVLLGADARWRQVSAGGLHSAGIKSDGTLWTWGNNDLGALGDGTTLSRAEKRQVGTRTDWAHVHAGQHRTFAVTTGGELWAWGNNAGALGDGDTVQRHSPVQVGAGTRWAKVWSGGSFAVALAADGTLWTWGTNPFGQLGDGTTTDRQVPGRVGTDADWVAATAGDDHVLAVRADGSLWGWGRNLHGTLGDGTTVGRLVPARIGTGADWAAVDAGSYASFGIRHDGTLWGWGWNAHSQLGDGGGPDQLVPRHILVDKRWASVSGRGFARRGAVTTDGQLWTWGMNADGTARMPLRLGGTSTTWVAVTVGNGHGVALTSKLLP